MQELTGVFVSMDLGTEIDERKDDKLVDVSYPWLSPVTKYMVLRKTETMLRCDA